jgi:hypothetical protein
MLAGDHPPKEIASDRLHLHYPGGGTEAEFAVASRLHASVVIVEAA